MPCVLVTGANRGIGLEFARQYLADGWTVFAACRQPAAAAALKTLANSAPGRLTVVGMDVTKIASVRDAATKLDDAAIDLLINCAGIIGVSGQRVGRINYESWANVLDVDTLGPMRVLECFVEHVARSDKRLVVTVSSGLGSIGDNTSGGSIAYRSSKAAVNMAMRSAAHDLAARGITCVVVNPGWVRTDMGGPGATLTAQDSVTALRRVIETLGPDRSGKFLDYDGSEYPW